MFISCNPGPQLLLEAEMHLQELRAEAQRERLLRQLRQARQGQESQHRRTVGRIHRRHPWNRWLKGRLASREQA